MVAMDLAVSVSQRPTLPVPDTATCLPSDDSAIWRHPWKPQGIARRLPPLASETIHSLFPRRKMRAESGDHATRLPWI